MSPLFSVVIPLYNHERYVLEAVESVLAQTEVDFELIIVDDGSSDGSVDQLKELTDPRIRQFSQTNSGAHAALNRGIELAQGQWVAVLNSDDVFHPDRLKVAREWLDKDPSLGAFFSSYDFIDEDSALIRSAEEIQEHWADPMASMSEEAGELLTGKEEVLLKLLGGNFLHSTSNLIIRREALEAIGAFSAYRYVHDYDFFLRLAVREKIVCERSALLQYRLHEENTLKEDAAESVYETGLVLIDFFSRNFLSVFLRDDLLFFEVYQYLYDALRGYGADRMLLTGLLARDSQDEGVDMASRLNGNPQTRAFLLNRLVAATALDAEQAELQWQKGQTEHWWKESVASTRRVEEGERELEWQRGQTHHWWQEAGEREESREWQKKQTDIWWQRSEERAAQIWERDQSLNEKETELEEIRRSLEWQKEQTDNWWAESQKREAQIAADRRWLGMAGVVRMFRIQVSRVFR